MSTPGFVPPEFNLPLSWVGPEGIGEQPFDDAAPPEALEIEGDDPSVALRRTLGLFATGVTIITTRLGEQVHGMTANAFMSVSLERRSCSSRSTGARRCAAFCTRAARTG